MATRPSEIDPLLGTLAPRALASPLSAAAAYGILAICTTLIAAAAERRLTDSSQVFWNGHHLIVHPFLSNVSTILDFAILNPLTIFFLLRSRQIAITDSLITTNHTPGDTRLRWFASLVCVVLAAVLMTTYAHSFLYGNFFDAVVTMSQTGECFVTVTGWVVLFWTGLFTYVLLMGALNQVSYTVRICQLVPAELTYDPLHEDGAAGLRVLAKPAIEFTKASVCLLIVGLVIWVYDHWMMKSALTDRTTSIGLFILIVFPLFAIPIARLHRLMCDLREQLLKFVIGRELRGPRRMALFCGRRRPRHSLKELADELDASDKLRRTILSFPTWPIPTETLVSCSAYFLSLSAPLFTKLVPLISAALAISS
jgi:hypothetical protein